MLPYGKYAMITKGADLMPVIVDRVQVSVVKDGKTKGGKIDAAHLAAMLKSDAFLSQFTSVDYISATPVYLPDFLLTQPGFNAGGPDHHIIYVGAKPAISNDLQTINAFLNVMAFETRRIGRTQSLVH